MTKTEKHTPEEKTAGWRAYKAAIAEGAQTAAERDRLKEVNAELLAAAQARLNEWHSNARNFERKEPQSVKLGRAAIAKAQEVR